jgi:hypothetical protein
MDGVQQPRRRGLARVLIGIGAVVVIAAAASAVFGGDSSATACEDAPVVAARDLLADVPSGYRVEPAPASAARDVTANLPAQLRGKVRDPQVVLVTRRNEPRVVAITLTSTAEEFENAEVLKGARESASGARPFEIGGQEAVVLVQQDVHTAVSGAGKCGAVYLVAREEPELRRIAEAVKLPD